MTETTVDPTAAAHVHRLLEEAKLLESAFDTTPAPYAAAAPTVPVPPPGYTLRTIHRTTADGGSEVSYEVVPLAPIPDFTPSAGPLPAAGHRNLPDWLTANSRKVKAACYLIGGGSLAALAAIYGPAVGAGAAAAAAGLWAATLTGLKFITAIVVGAVVIGAMAGGKSGSRKPKTGTFEGIVTGTWKQD
ncbi:hypothetical protein AB0F18_16685 [Streptomyces sp. NPDC029216]|uniref:hypothetical protein n=1 Tax=Streptomyces sp. NPDC029216 TaxID=3154701 RepID=UPI0034116DF3